MASSYPPEYEGPRPIEEQILKIAKAFGLDPTHALEFAKKLPALPDGAEGWFAVPKVSALAVKYFSDSANGAEKYCRAVRMALEKIAESRPFVNYLDGQIAPARLRVLTHTQEKLAYIEREQPGEIMIIAAQFGKRYAGRSVRQAREDFVANEFGLGAFTIGIMLLTHPEREVRWEQLHVDCAGDECFRLDNGIFSRAPLFVFHGGEVKFYARWFDGASGSSGSASAFLSP